MKKLFAASTIAALLIIGCKKDDAAPTATGSTGTLTMTLQYTPSQLPKAYADTIKLDTVRLVLKEIKFKTKSDTVNGNNFKTNPFVMTVDLSGNVQNIGVNDLPYGAYNRIEFSVHKVDSVTYNALAASDKPSFAPFVLNSASVIVKGRINDTSFTFYAKVHMPQKIDVDPAIVIDENNKSVSVGLTISSFDWFKDKSGKLIDPRTKDQSLVSVIENNIKNSIKKKR